MNRYRNHMGGMVKFSLVCLLCFLTVALAADITVERNGYRISIGDDGSSLIGITDKRSGSVFAGKQEMWEMRFKNGKTLNASQFLASGKFSQQSTADRLTLHYTGPDCNFDIVFDLRDDEFDCRVANLKNQSSTITMMAVPVQWTFPLGGIKRFVFPSQANWSKGICFLPSFFEKRSEEEVIYGTQSIPFNGIKRLFIAPGSKAVGFTETIENLIVTNQPLSPDAVKAR